MTAQTILPANSASSGSYQVANSVRFDDGSGDILARSNGTPSSQRLFTFSGWYKKATLASGVNFQFFALYNDNTDRMDFRFQDGDTIDFRNNAPRCRITTNRLFRDPSAWYHVVLRVDTTQSTAANRIRLYVNGVQETSFSAADYGDQNDDLITNASTFAVGDDSYGTAHYDGNMSEVVYCDGQSLAPTSFGEFDEDSGIWKPISVSGLTFGDEGVYLNFENAAELGTDVSGNGNTYAETGLAATDQSIDTCTNNFATMNPLMPLGSNIAYSDGNLTITPGTSDYKTTASTIAVGSGKWYAEFKAVSGHNGSTDVSVGIVGADNHIASTGSKAMSAYLSSFSYGSGGLVKKYNGVTIRTDATYTNDNIIGIAVDMDNLKLYWSKDGAFQNSGDPTSGATGTGAVAITPAQLYYIAVATISSGGVKVFSANFGSPPYSESGGETDGDGYGNFAHAVPSGYFALCTKNLAEYG